MDASRVMGLIEEWLASTHERPGSTARPLVTLSYAQSLDGSIAARRGEPYALSGHQSLELTHRLRAAHDAILVGIGTILSDDPQLNVRFAEGKDPQIVVLDSKGRLPLNAKTLANSHPPIVFCTSQAELRAVEGMQALGVRIEQQSRQGRVDLQAALQRLAELGIKRVMVEGGGEILASFLEDGLADRAVITIAPVFLNGYRISAKAIRRLRVTGSASYGDDTVIWGEFAHEAN